MANAIDAYLNDFEGIKLFRLQEMRSILQKALPDAVECISYGMPAFKTSEVLVYFAGNKNHIGFYPTSRPIEVFEQELKKWKFSKGAIQFPYDKPLPKQLIKAIAIMRRKDTRTSSNKKCTLKSQSHLMKKYDTAIARMDQTFRESGLAKPALRALIDHGILTIHALQQLDPITLNAMHGIGPKAMNIIKQLINERN
jgi:uncharacterized protein YdhG (YjbR/CyaY superfamily)